MCSAGWNNTPNGECEKCGQETTDGTASYGCEYSPVVCETCQASPCDLSC